MCSLHFGGGWVLVSFVFHLTPFSMIIVSVWGLRDHILVLDKNIFMYTYSEMCMCTVYTSNVYMALSSTIDIYMEGDFFLCSSAFPQSFLKHLLNPHAGLFHMRQIFCAKKKLCDTHTHTQNATLIEIYIISNGSNNQVIQCLVIIHKWRLLFWRWDFSLK